jgi:hypothetical protein
LKENVMRIPVPKEKSLATTLLGFANSVAGGVEWLEAVEGGEEPMRAAKKAYRNAQRRARAVKKNQLKSPEGHAHTNDKGGVVIDVTPRVENQKKVGTS